MSQVLSWLEAYWITIFRWCRAAQFELTSYIFDVLEHLILFCFIYLLVCFILYILLMQRKLFSFEKDVKEPKRVLFVTGHPDDETMFFGPTLLSFTQRTDCEVYLLCLSTGRNYGMGCKRRNELYEACKILGIRDENIIVQNHTCLPDAMDANWPTEIVSQLILNQVELYAIDTLITFDKHGISRHINHCSIYYAVAYLSTEKKIPDYCRVYVLESVNIIRKYWLILDIPLCYLFSRIRYITTAKQRSLLRNAMKQHKSQLVWYRYLYLYTSRYLLINTLQLMNKIDIELDLEVDD